MNYIIKDYSLLCNVGSTNHNEDVVGFTPFGGWVLDGATGLNGKNLVSDISDAKWYVQWWNTYLHKNISNNESLKDIMSKGITLITNDYKEKLNGIKVDKLDLPSGSIVVVKFHQGKLEYLMLGDCTLFVDNGMKQVIKDRTLCKFDDVVYDEMINKINNENKSFQEARTEVQDIVVTNRLKKNSKEGYWILEFEEEAIENSLHGYLDINSNSTFMLASDGYTSACDRYDLFKEEEMLDVAKEKGIEYIYNSLREFEGKDPDSLKIPRFKVNDDSSCLYFKLDLK